jgi:hypothetical protein
MALENDQGASVLRIELSYGTACKAQFLSLKSEFSLSTDEEVIDLARSVLVTCSKNAKQGYIFGFAKKGIFYRANLQPANTSQEADPLYLEGSAIDDRHINLVYDAAGKEQFQELMREFNLPSDVAVFNLGLSVLVTCQGRRKEGYAPGFCKDEFFREWLLPRKLSGQTMLNQRLAEDIAEASGAEGDDDGFGPFDPENPDGGSRGD